RLDCVGRAGTRRAPRRRRAGVAASRLDASSRGDDEAPHADRVVTAAGRRPGDLGPGPRRRRAGAVSARHRVAVPGKARRVRRRARVDLLSTDAERAHDLRRRLLDGRAGYGPSPRGGAPAEDRELGPLLPPPDAGGAGRTARRLDGGGTPLPRPLGVEAAPLRNVVAAAVMRQLRSGSPVRSHSWSGVASGFAG